MAIKKVKSFVNSKKTEGLAKVYISASFNNTLVNICDERGGTVAWGSSGAAGFKGTRRSTPFAATTAVENALKKIKDSGISELEIYVKGPGPGRDAALRAIKASGIKISLIADVTPIPHNGPRPKKKRRV